MNINSEIFLQFIPIGISVFAFIVSAISLGWNIYRDVILKPRLKIQFSLSQIIHPNLQKPIDTLILSATNFGPGLIKCNMIKLREAPLWRRILRKTRYAAMIYDYENPLSGKLPARLEVGEGIDLLIRWEKECFLKDAFTHIGLSDSFGRVHWASSKDITKTREIYRKEFLK